MTTREVVVIPVPLGMTPEEAWEEIATFDQILDPRPIIGWAIVAVED